MFSGVGLFGRSSCSERFWDGREDLLVFMMGSVGEVETEKLA